MLQNAQILQMIFQMEKLQAIGFKGVAYRFLKDEVVTAYTTDTQYEVALLGQ